MLKVKHLLILQAFALFATFLLTTNASAVEFDLDTLPTGQFEVNMYPPVTYDEWMIMNEAIDEQAPGWGITSGGTEYCENANSCKLVYHGTEWTENYYPIHYNYDANVKAAVDNLMHSAGVDASRKTYHVQDLELLFTWVAEDMELETDLSNFSSEFRKALGNANLNFSIDPRGGCEAPLLTCKLGIGKTTQLYNGVPTLYYMIPSVEILSENIFYVPSSTAEDQFATALAARINGLYGEGIATVAAADRTVADLGVTADELEYLPHINSLEEKVYTIIINYDEGSSTAPHDILIRADSAKMFTPSINSTDLATGINISSDAPNLPSDVMTYAEIDTGPDEVATELLGTEDYVTYELGLFTNTFRGEITDAEGYDFTVGIPVPAALNGKTLSAYWIHHTEDGDELEEHYANVVNGVAYYNTDHFSTYILAESSANRPADAVVPGAPNTSRASEPSVISSIAGTLLSLSFLLSVAGVVYATFAPRTRQR